MDGKQQNSSMKNWKNFHHEQLAFFTSWTKWRFLHGWKSMFLFVVFFWKTWCWNSHWIVSVNDDFFTFQLERLELGSTLLQHTSITCIGKYNLIWLHNSSWMMFWVSRCVIMVIWRRETLWLQSATLVLGWKHDGSLEKRDSIFITPVCNPAGSLMETLPTFGSYYWVQLNIFVGGPATTTVSFHYGNTSFVSL